MTPAPPASTGGSTRGALFALGAYLLWGVLPIYFLQLKPTDPFEVVAWRIILAFAFCLLLLTVMRVWRPFLVIVRQPRLMALTAVAGVLIYVNWQTYLIGALTGHVIETSLGYFINPIVTVLLGVVVLRERLRVLPWIAIGIAVAAVVVIVVGYGAFPWIALTLAFSFGFYGLVKKQIGPAVDAVSGLTLESFWLLPVAVVQLIVVANVTGITLGNEGVLHTVLLLAAGAVTAVPLLLFASGARRVPLTVIGLLQFVAPVIQFVIGAWVLHEPMTPERWVGFALVWAALALLSVDSLVASRRHRRAVDDVPEPV
ncbi:EamA family transporter RarD [Microbacterium enclense]|uniref:Chloramphenicol-sensitive protein RarD n=1 Tax=Microbacterium enclense TaxID=993073 RepID=A0A1G6GV21_9MICO|nr:EamA family transporter RarD [Microbacterium enclense]KSU55962.1 protein rarD [Microbacterium enclense]MCM3613037.1 EamA family transporter RarD [Microbacterium enclense]SDB85829.1 chloramphenicol-sensitive protein RarD [Microbacterium enclense]